MRKLQVKYILRAYRKPGETGERIAGRAHGAFTAIMVNYTTK